MNGVSLKPWRGAQPCWGSFNIANWNHCTVLNSKSVSWWICAVLNNQTCGIGYSSNRNLIQQTTKRQALRFFPEMCKILCLQHLISTQSPDEDGIMNTLYAWRKNQDSQNTGDHLGLFDSRVYIIGCECSSEHVHVCLCCVHVYVCSQLSMETRGQHQLSFLSNTHHFLKRENSS